MFNQQQCKGRILVNGMALATALVMGSYVLPGWAGFNPPGKLRRPGNRFGLATRGSGPQCSADWKRPLTTVVPKTLYGQTLSGHPTVYWYMPNRNTYESARFVLYEVDDANLHQVYRSEFMISGQAGIASLKLPEDMTVSPLEVGKTYRWMVVLVCADEPSLNVFAEGWIERVNPSANFKTKLAATKPEERFRVYAEAGLWYDMLHNLAHQRQANPMNPVINQEWQTLMESKVVDLSKLSNQPFVLSQP